MKQYAILRILFACFCLYLAWPAIPTDTSDMASIFWAGWLVFFLLVVGSNLATLLRITEPPIMEKDNNKQLQTGKN